MVHNLQIYQIKCIVFICEPRGHYFAVVAL